MRFLIDILHPAHVHFFRPFVQEMEKRGHECLLAARDKDVALGLLDHYDLPFELLSRQAQGRTGLLGELAVRSARFVKLTRKFQPNHLIGLMGPVIGIAGRLSPARATVFYDNESARRVNRLVYTLADSYWTPHAFRDDYGPKHARYRGYHELAYLHPNRFTPDERILAQYGLSAREPYFLVRFVAWRSIHDGGESGFTTGGKGRLVQMLSKHGKILLSSEGPLPRDLETWRLRIRPEHVHHVLAFARLVVGESSTMASEACLLGTHAVYVSKTGRGINDEQEARYGLSHHFTSGQERAVFARIEELLDRSNLEHDAQTRRDRLLAENIDVTEFLVRYFESDCRDTSAAWP